MMSSAGPVASNTSQDYHRRRRNLKRRLLRRPRAVYGKIRSSSTSPPAQPAVANVTDQLYQLVQHVRKTASDYKVANDSGVSFSGESSSSHHVSRDASASSKASTITPETAVYRSSTLTADKFARRPPSSDTTNSDSLGVPSILTQLDSGQADRNDVVASPSTLRAHEIFFARASPTPASTLSPQDINLEDTWASLATELKPLADVMRTGRLRTPLGHSQLPLHCVSALELWLDLQTSTPEDHTSSSAIEALTQTFRVLANLCIDHERNRTMLHQLNTAPVILDVAFALVDTHSRSRSTAIFSVKFLALLRAAMGAVLNMQLEHIPTRNSLVNRDCLATLTQIATHPRFYTPNVWTLPQTVELQNDKEGLEKIKIGAVVCSWAWRIIQEVYDDAKEDHEASDKVDMLEDGEEDNAADADVRSLLSTHCLQSMLQPLLLYAPSKLLDELANAPQPFLDLSADDVEELVEADIEILLTACELVEGCARDDHTFRVNAVASSDQASTNSKGSTTALDLLMTFVEKASIPSAWAGPRSGSESEGMHSVGDQEASAEAVKTFSKAKTAIARAVVAISGDDANMVELFDPSSGFIDRLKVWMRYDSKERDDLVSCGMLALGNLARSDSHCLSLVQEHELAPFLASALSQSSDIKVAHGIVSLLKNLSIPLGNKILIGDLGFIDAVVPYLGKDKDMVQPLQFATVGLLKHLCASVSVNAIRLVGGENGKDGAGLNTLIDLIHRIDDLPTKLESTRVLVNVVKSLWSAPKSGTRAVPDDVRSAARNKVMRRDVIQALAEMVRTSPKYPVLVNEGILALTLLGSDRSGAELVSLSLLSEPKKALADEDESDLDLAEDDRRQSIVASRKRRSTGESVGSTSSHPMPPPPSALDMVNSVLARRDARMPPQFACNACTLVLSLCQAAISDDLAGMQTDGASAGAVGRDAIVQLARQTQAALELLNAQGPIEALEPAASALQAVLRATAS